VICEKCRERIRYSEFSDCTIAACSCGKLILEGEAASLLPRWDVDINKEGRKYKIKALKDTPLTIELMSLLFLFTMMKGVLCCPRCKDNTNTHLGDLWPVCTNCSYGNATRDYSKAGAALSMYIGVKGKQISNMLIWNINSILAHGPEELIQRAKKHLPLLESVTPNCTLAEYLKTIFDD